jgi:hemerythrin-like domain-containing protein
MHHAIDTLQHEHEAITLGLKILTRMDERMSAEHITDTQDLVALTDFLKAFADTCHHGKEEGILFPAMKAKEAAQTQAPVQRMLDEHAEGRRHLADMRAALQPAVDTAAFHEAARAYTALLLAHIDKEDTVLFPMARRLFSGPEQSEMADAFEAYENQVMGPGQHEALHATLKRLLAKYPA